ncbi:MAG: hypothetical protein ACI9QQ_001945, partial [Myxococcota bacterium]
MGSHQRESRTEYDRREQPEAFMTTSHRLSSASNRATPATETNGYLGAYVGREATIDLSPDTFNCALRSVANEELDL